MSKKNYTFSLPEDLVDKFKRYAKQKYVSSVNMAVKEALEEYSVKIEKQQLHEAMKQAANDPRFMTDLEESMEAFSELDTEAGDVSK